MDLNPVVYQDPHEFYRRFEESRWFRTYCPAVVGRGAFGQPILCGRDSDGAAYDKCEEHR